jgi:hypothetical protein
MILHLPAGRAATQGDGLQIPDAAPQLNSYQVKPAKG